MSESAHALGPFGPIRPARVDWDGSTPVSPAYGDTYFSRGRGAEESRAVFVDGNALQPRFAGLPAGGLFVIGETGFGTGLNCLLAAEAFLRTAPAGARLALVSAELHPLSRADLARAHAGRPDPLGLAAALVEHWPPPVAGFHRISLAENVDLTLLFGDAAKMWSRAACRVDAWFLDGFAPDRNPAMWTDGLFRALAARSRPGATLATFTVAGRVRRGLEAAGFEVARRPGFGGKRHRLVGRIGGRWTPQHCRTGTAVVAGAGLAGASCARALAERGWEVRVLDPAGVAGGASGNRAGAVYTTPSGHLDPQNRFYRSSYLEALAWFRRHRFPAGAGQGRLDGLVLHLVEECQERRAALALESGLWPGELLRRLDERSVLLEGAGAIDPRAWCRLLLDHPAIRHLPQSVSGFRPGSPVAVLLDGGGELAADALVLATAGAARRLPGLDWLPLKDIRGQVTECRATPESLAWRRTHCHAGYLTPALDGVHCLGATFNLHEHDPAPRQADDAANLAGLEESLPGRWRALGGRDIRVVGHRVGFRCNSTDYLPLCGPLPDAAAAGVEPLPGIALDIAFGSRGITGTPLCAGLLADRLTGLPPPVDRELLDALDPARFIHRFRRRDPGWRGRTDQPG